jgi:hypothetical protein
MPATAGIGVARDRAGLAGAACDRRVGVRPEQTGGRREDRGDGTAMGLTGLVVDEALRGWPSAAEWLPAACDADVAPFDRGSIEVRVGPTKGRVRLPAYGVRGRPHRGEMGVPPGARPPDALTGSPVGWAVERPRKRGACFTRLARVGPTTPTRAGRLADASVDHTEARKTQTGLTGEQASTAVGISPRAADWLWAYARAWLFERMHPDAR